MMASADRSVLERNKALVRRYLEGIFRGNLDILDEVISPEYYFGRPPDPSDAPAAAQYRAGFGAFRRSFPDLRINNDSMIAEDDLVAFHATVRGTHLGEFRGVPPTGRQATWTITGFRRVRDDKLLEGFDSWAFHTAFDQLGAVVTIDGVVAQPRGLTQRPRGAPSEW
jgi:steroid delta-isomerase-like uncharacterized protein